MPRDLRFLVLGLGLALFCTGCPAGWSWRDFDADKRLDLSEDSEPGIEGRNQAVYQNSIAEMAWFEGLRRMRVQGYGVVVGLGKGGSTVCPREIRSRLLEELYKRPAFEALRFNKEGFTPERLIDDPGTAVVQVQGEIPAAAVTGTRFDVSVSAIPGDETTSLRGGRLVACDLHIYRMLSPQAGLMGKTLAHAQGPLFMNPFSDRPGAATRSVSRVGTIVGGGRAATNRRIRLALFKPSYTTAKRIASRINARFPAQEKVADAVSPSYVKLVVPAAYADDARHFLEVIQHLYLKQNAGFATRQTRLLADLITKAGAPQEDIALAWEGLGRTVLPTIGKLYAHDDPYVRYFAALAGLRLDDPVAVTHIAEHAADARSPLRFQAVEALGAAREVFRAEAPLLQLIDHDDPLMRVAAYEALLKRESSAIHSRWLGHDNFALDVLPSTRLPLVYAKRTGSRRIALLGGPIR
ncbi:MAG: flagellar basal body P-ring protein FlgI, partial [Phycisphaerae bacterium]